MFLLRSRHVVVCATVLLVAAMARADNQHGQNGTVDNNEDNRGAKLGRLVVVGDSLSAGFQNFSLFDSDSLPGAPAGGQKHGFAALIAQQAGVNLNLPLISLPGIPPVLTISATGQIMRGTAIGTRENPTIQTLDLSVPGFTVKDALARVIDTTNVTNPIDLLALQVLATPGPVPCGALGFNNGVLTISEVACAVQLKPSTVIVSIGNNDALGSLIFGVPPTNTAEFAAEYGQLLQTLKSTGARVVAGNIPDVTAIPFLVSAPAFHAVCGFLPLGVGAADFLVPDLISPTVTSVNICTNFFVRPAAFIAQVQAAVRQYNGIIAAEANAAGAVVVDVNGLFSRLSQNGVNVDGRLLTTTFLGGLFSLDGIHPTNTGYAILANEYIRTINGELHAGISPVSVEQVSKTDPLLPPKKY
jgi:lysophospholipase L1-like esterase